jgi:hypothetical protein
LFVDLNEPDRKIIVYNDDDASEPEAENYHLYVLALKGEPLIKPGITKDPIDRIRQLGGPERFDLSKSYLVTAKDEDIIKRLEASLKALLAEHQRESAVRLSSGNTEILCEKALPKVLGLIQSFRALWPDSDKVSVEYNISHLFDKNRPAAEVQPEPINRQSAPQHIVTMNAQDEINIQDAQPGKVHDKETLDFAIRALPVEIREQILLLATDTKIEQDDPVFNLMIAQAQVLTDRVEELKKTMGRRNKFSALSILFDAVVVFLMLGLFAFGGYHLAYSKGWQKGWNKGWDSCVKTLEQPR